MSRDRVREAHAMVIVSSIRKSVAPLDTFNTSHSSPSAVAQATPEPTPLTSFQGTRLRLRVSTPRPALLREGNTLASAYESVERTILERNLSANRRISKPLMSAVNRKGRFFERFSPCRDDIPALNAPHKYKDLPVVEVGKTLVPKSEIKEDPWLDFLFEENRLSRSEHVPTVAISHDFGDRDRDEFFEPTNEQIDHWRKRWTTIDENGKRLFKPMEAPRFQKKQHARGFKGVPDAAPQDTQHLSNRRDTALPDTRFERIEFIDHHGLSSSERDQQIEPDYADSSLYDYIQRDASTEHPITTERNLNVGFGPGVGVVPATDGLLSHLVDKTEKEIRPRVELDRIQALMDLWDLRVLARTFQKEGSFDTEAELRKAMGKKHYYPPEIARSRVIRTTARTLMTKKPRPESERPQPGEDIDITEISAPDWGARWRHAINKTFKKLYSGADGLYILLKQDRQPIRAYLLTALDETFDKDSGLVIDSMHLKFLINKLSIKLGLPKSAFHESQAYIKVLTFDGDSCLIHDYLEFFDNERPLKRNQLKLTLLNQ